jgi:hypothetical protein
MIDGERGLLVTHENDSGRGGEGVILPKAIYCPLSTGQGQETERGKDERQRQR